MILNCIGKDSAALDAMKGLWMNSLVKLSGEGKEIDFKSVYNHVMATNMIENMDAESAAFLYQEIKIEASILDRNIESHMTSEGDLDNIARGAALTRAMEGLKGDNPAMAAARALIDFLNQVHFHSKSTSNSKQANDIKQLVSDYAKSVVGERKYGKTVDILSEALKKDMESESFGQGADAMFEALKEKLKEAMAAVKDPVTKKILENELSKIQAASFNMGITATKRKKILYDAIKASQYGKDTPSGKRVVDWNKLAAQEDLNKTLDSILGDALDKRGYKGDKSRVYKALIDEYEEIKRARSYVKAFESLDLKGTSIVKRLAEEVAISRGFFKTIDGKKVVDYNARSIDAEKLLTNEMALVKIPATGTVKERFEALVAKYIEDKKFDQIKDSMIRLMAHNNKPFKQKITDLDRLSRLQNVTGLDGTTSALAGKILGLPVSAVSMAKMDALVKQYKELMDFETKEVGLNENYTPALFAQVAPQAIIKEMGDLLRVAALSDQIGAVRATEALMQWQRVVLSNTLSSFVNVTQNTLTGVIGISVAGQDYAKVGTFKRIAGVLMQHIMRDFNSESNRVEVSGIKNVYDADTTAEKVLAVINTASSALLNGMDGLAAYNGISRSFYRAIENEIRAKYSHEDKAKVDAKVKELMGSIFTPENAARAIGLAAKYLRIAGITEASVGTKRYKRLLTMESENVQRAFVMSGKISEEVNPERVIGYKKSAERLTEMQLGRAEYQTVEGGHKKYHWNMPLGLNYYSTILQQVRAANNDALKKLSTDPSGDNVFRYLLTGWGYMLLNGGPFAFMGGATRWADKAFGDIINIRYAITGTVRKRRKAYNKLVNSDGKTDNTEYNTDETMAAYENYEISRRRLKESANAWLRTAAIVSLAVLTAGPTGGDDDEWYETIWKKVKQSMLDLGNDHPILHLALQRIAMVQIRLIYSVAKYGKDGDPFGTFQDVMGSLFNTAIPGNVFDKYYRKGDDAADIGAKVSKDVIGAFAGLGPILNFGGFAGLVNPIIDEINGSRKKLNFTDSPIIPGTVNDPTFWEGVYNGAGWGISGTHFGYLIDPMGIGRTSGIEIGVDDYHKSFREIDWSKYGEAKWNTRKEQVTLATNKLDAIGHQIDAFGRKFDIDGFNMPGDYTKSYDRYYKGIFSVDIKDVNLAELRRYLGKPKYKIPESGKINLIEVARDRLRLKVGGDEINIEDVETAIKFNNLKKKVSK